MDYGKTGELIRRLRGQRGVTQLELAKELGVSDKAVSKWERGCGLPDIALLPRLSSCLNVDISCFLGGELPEGGNTGGNMKKLKFYVCPECGNISLCTGEASVACCGRPLEPLASRKASDEEKLSAERIENEWYVSSDLPMTKEDYVAFLCLVTEGAAQLMRLYPEWDLSVRLPSRGHGTLFWYSAKSGLLFQYI